MRYIEAEELSFGAVDHKYKQKIEDQQGSYDGFDVNFRRFYLLGIERASTTMAVEDTPGHIFLSFLTNHAHIFEHFGFGLFILLCHYFSLPS